jgi:predicted ATPase
VSYARTLGHPFTLAAALFWESLVHWIRRDPAAEQIRAADEVIALSERQSFPFWIGLAKAFRGAALAHAGGGPVDVAAVSEGLGMAGGTGAQAGVPALLGLLAEAHLAVGQPDQAMPIVEMALAISADTGQPLWDAELHRLKGELMLSLAADAPAERLFRRALDIARAQEARSLELRAARSLARLLHARGNPAQGRAILAPVRSWFREGFATRDLVEASSLLEQLDPRRFDTGAVAAARPLS